MPEPKVVEQDREHHLQLLLDQELSRLPDKYRVVILLCDLEGKTRKEAARQLDVPEGTVGGRLARARAMLAKRLARHHPQLSGAVLAALLSQCAASACVPATVVMATIKAATLVAAGQNAASVISVNVAALTEGVLKAMLMTKFKIAAVVLLVLGVVTGGGLLTYNSLGAERFETSEQGQADQQAKPNKQGNAGDAAAPNKQEDEAKKQLEALRKKADQEQARAEAQRALAEAQRQQAEIERARAEANLKLAQEAYEKLAGKTIAAPQLEQAEAEKQVAVKQTGATIARHQVVIAKARLDMARAALEGAKASLKRWDAETKRIRDLVKAAVVDVQVLNETEAKLAVAKAAVDEAEAKAAIAEQELLIEQARLELASAELGEAQACLQRVRPAEPQPKTEAVVALLKTQLNAAQQAQRAAQDGLGQVKKVGGVLVVVTQPAEAYNWSIRWLHAQSDLSPTKEERIAAFADHTKRMKNLKETVDKLSSAVLPAFESAAATWYVAEAELWLLQERAR